MKKVTGIFLAASVLCFWVMVSLVIAAPPFGKAQQTTPVQGTSQFSAQQPLVPTDVRPEGFVLITDGRKIKVGESGIIFAPSSVRLHANVLLCGCVNSSVWVRFDVDGQIIKEFQAFQSEPSPAPCAVKTACNNLPGKERSVEADWTAVKGSHTLRIIVDSKNDIHETNEQNNTMSIVITVAGHDIEEHQVPLNK